MFKFSGVNFFAEGLASALLVHGRNVDRMPLMPLPMTHAGTPAGVEPRLAGHKFVSLTTEQWLLLSSRLTTACNN